MHPFVYFYSLSEAPMSLTTHSMYQKHILRCLNFSPAALPFGQLWRDPAAADNGFCYIFERPAPIF